LDCDYTFKNFLAYSYSLAFAANCNKDFVGHTYYLHNKASINCRKNDFVAIVEETFKNN